MSIRNHVHTSKRDFKRVNTDNRFAAVVGTVDTNAEKIIDGRSGEHLQFEVIIDGSTRYQVDVNTQSRDGSAVFVCIADEVVQPTDGELGAAQFGVFAAPAAQLSYSKLGLQDAQFTQISSARIEAQLEATLSQSVSVALYGFVFDDGGPDGKGIHETHFNPGDNNEDGAVAVYIQPDDGQASVTRRWFFFKFSGENIGN
jgi:hypothetical protein